jgi:hypothetical protein
MNGSDDAIMVGEDIDAVKIQRCNPYAKRFVRSVRE